VIWVTRKEKEMHEFYKAENVEAEYKEKCEKIDNGSFEIRGNIRIGMNDKCVRDLLKRATEIAKQARILAGLCEDFGPQPYIDERLLDIKAEKAAENDSQA